MALLVLASGPLAVWPARLAVAQGPALEESIVAAEIVVGRYYRQAGGASGLGYDVREPFFTPYLTFGGPAAVGYPVSVPFRAGDGCVYQGFQILLLQACEALPVRPANTFEILEQAGADPLLMGLGIGSAERDTGATLGEAVGIRLGWLTDGAIKSRYLADCGGGDAASAIERCGLPMNRPQRFGPFVSQRFQRIAYQRWLDDGPAGIKTGDVTPVLGGDLLKTSGTLPAAIASPHARESLPRIARIEEAQFTSIAYTPATERNGPPVDFRDRATLGILQTQVNTSDQTTPSLFQPGRQGQELIVGDRVRTDANGTALVTYFEGTTAEIGPSSEVVVQRVVTGESGLALPNLTLSQVAGQVIYRLTRALLPGARLDIQTPSATATVRGTVLRVSVLPDGGTRVEVFSGQVDVAAAGIVVSVWPGTFTEVTPGQPPAPPALNPPAAPFILTNPDPSTGPSSFLAPGGADALGGLSSPEPAGSASVPQDPTASGPVVPDRQTPPPSSATAAGTTTAPTAAASPTNPTPMPTGTPLPGAPASTSTPTPTSTVGPGVPTSTPEATPEVTPTSSPVPPSTSTPPPAPTATRTPTVGPSSTARAATPSPATATATPSLPPAPTATPSVTASPTATATATLSPSSTPTATSTPTPGNTRRAGGDDDDD